MYQLCESRLKLSQNVSPSSVIGIFGLSPRTREDDLKAEFEKFGDLENVTIIYDRRTGDSKRFGFIYFKSVDDAIKAKEGLKGLVCILFRSCLSLGRFFMVRR